MVSSLCKIVKHTKLLRLQEKSDKPGAKFCMCLHYFLLSFLSPFFSFLKIWKYRRKNYHDTLLHFSKPTLQTVHFRKEKGYVIASTGVHKETGPFTKTRQSTNLVFLKRYFRYWDLYEIWKYHCSKSRNKFL